MANYLNMLLLLFLFTFILCVSLSATSNMDDLNDYMTQENISGYHIIVKKTEFILTLYSDSIIIKTYPCAIGKGSGDKQRQSDYCTPEGNFYVESIEESSRWKHDFKGDNKGPIIGCYGPWFYRLYTGANSTNSGLAWKGYAIHGTHDPDSIGHKASEGCIRLRNEDILELRQYVYRGMPVRIEN